MPAQTLMFFRSFPSSFIFLLEPPSDGWRLIIRPSLHLTASRMFIDKWGTAQYLSKAWLVVECSVDRLFVVELWRIPGIEGSNSQARQCYSEGRVFKRRIRLCPSRLLFCRQVRLQHFKMSHDVHSRQDIGRTPLHGPSNGHVRLSNAHRVFWAQNPS